MASSNQLKKPLAYAVVPAVFCVFGYLLIWAALQPVWGMASVALSMLVADDAPSFDSNLSVTYDPNAAKPKAEEKPQTQDQAQDQAQSQPAQTYIKGADVEFPNSGDQYGRVQCGRIGLDAPVYWYDSDEILAYGVGQSLSSMPPGFGEVIVLAGHNTTDFAPLRDIAEGDVVQFKTNYCDYEYTVTHIEVLDENVLANTILDKAMTPREELIMYTCWPFEAITGRKTERLTVYADRTAGLDVKWRGLDE